MIRSWQERHYVWLLLLLLPQILGMILIPFPGRLSRAMPRLLA